MKALFQRYRAELLLVFLTVGGSLLVYLPFWSQMGTVYRAWDGPNYLTIAKTGYDVPDDYAILSYVYVESYFLRHFPVYPALIRLFSFVGYQRSMLLVSILCTAGAAILFYRLCRNSLEAPQPLFLASVFLFFPPRWLYFRSTGSTEAPFLLFVFAAIYLFEKDRVGWAAVMGALATLTRIPGLLVAPGPATDPDAAQAVALPPWLLLPPAALAGFFAYCWSRTGNFLEYFAQQGDKAGAFRPFGFMPHPLLPRRVPPGRVLHPPRLRLRHRDLAHPEVRVDLRLLGPPVPPPHQHVTEEWPRYWLVMAPFALVVGFHDIWETREAKWLFAIPVVMGFVYCWGAIPLNGILPDYWKLALAQLGLLGEWTPP